MEPYIFRAKGIRAIDGDTIECVVDLGFGLTATHHFRLWGIDTPEKRSHDPIEKEQAYVAQEFTASFIEDKNIMIQTYKAESFGRYLAKVFVLQPETNRYLCLNDMLVLEDLAVPFMTDTDLLT